MTFCLFKIIVTNLQCFFTPCIVNFNCTFLCAPYRINVIKGNILKNLKEVQGTEIPMQEFDDNTKEGVTYYSTAIQFSTKDARPVVGLSDKHFYFSTSQKFIAEIDKNLIAGGEVPVRKGSYTRINFSAAREMADYWVKLLKEKGIQVAHVTFPDEGHGFRKANNIIQAMESELAFYRDVFNLKDGT